MSAIKNNKVILRGTRNPNNKLWDVPIQKRGIKNKNYTMPPIHPAIYQKMNACLHNSWNEEQGKGLMQYHIKNQIKEKEIKTKSFLHELKRFNEIIDHNILDMFLDKNAPIKSTIDNEYKYIDVNLTKIQAVHSHLNGKPQQKKSRLTDITYLNKGYNANPSPLKQKKRRNKKNNI